MKAFRELPLGQPVPDSPHAVLCSLPRLDDVIGYEERRPATVAAMRVGYPRFLTHPLVVRAQAAAREAFAETLGPDRELRLVVDERLGAALSRFAGETAPQFCRWQGLVGVSLRSTDEARGKAKAFLQHTGAGITSRQAEDALVQAGLQGRVHPEEVFSAGAPAKVRGEIAAAFGVADPAAVLLTGSGMGAFYAVFNAVRAAQMKRGRGRWLQLGWQYVDTTEILTKFLGPGEQFHFWPDVFDQAGLEAFFQKYGSELAGVVAEFPTNPLFHAGDLPALKALCDRHGAVLIADPTLASPRVVNVLPHCDVAVNSLTKFAANAGDVMGGAAVFNPASPWAAALREPVAATLPPPYPRDLARLAAQIDGYPALIEEGCATAARLSEFLRRHPAVRAVHWPGEERSRAHFSQLARRQDQWGSVFSFVPRGDLARFYDRVQVVKGPSFGVNFTLLCPFMYLAHYDKVTTPAGRAELAALGLDPALVRVSVGREPYAEVEAAFAEALG